MKKNSSLQTRNKSARRPVKIPTAENLKNVALYYLSRFAASEASLRRVLDNRIRRAAYAHPDFAADLERRAGLDQAINQIVETHKRSGVVNDDVIADMKVRGLRRAGKSQRFISQKLATKGLAKPIIARALDDHDGDGKSEEADFEAARILCKKRRIGPYAPPNKREDTDRQKAYGILARAGFGSSIIKKLLKELPEGDFSEEFTY